MVSVGDLVTANTEYRFFNIDGEVTEVFDDETFKVKFEDGLEESHEDLDIVSDITELGVDNTPADDEENPSGKVLNKIYIHS
tara:strand:+ start:148 stop:393 length:246 start_codon:yes stop_codon:yes gene_type:complete